MNPSGVDSAIVEAQATAMGAVLRLEISIGCRTCGNLRERRAEAGRRPVLAGYMRLTAALWGAGCAASSTGSRRQADGSERYADTLSVAEDCVTVRGQFESRPMRGSLTDARQRYAVTMPSAISTTASNITRCSSITPPAGGEGAAL